MRWWILLALVGCGNVDVVGHVGGASGSGGAGGGGAQAICGGSFAERAFRFALCVCGQAQVNNVRTNVVDATSGATSRGGAAVGANGTLAPNGSDIGGSLLVRGDLTLPGSSQVDGDLKVAGALDGGNQSNVARDAWVDGNVNLPWNGLSVNRDVYAPVSQAPHGISVGGTFHQRSFAMTGPCDCGADAIVDVPSIVAAVRHSNDNDGIALAVNRLEQVTAAQELALPAGQFYLDAIGGTAQVTLHLSGRTVLAIGGDVHIGQLTIDVGSSGELDLFVGGSLLTGNIGIGNGQRPAASRIYVAGAQPITIDSFSGNLYAPAAQINSTASPAVVHGSVLAGAIMTGDLSIHYDASIGSAGASCGNPTSCTRSQDCVSGSACISGSCGGCSVDSDCAAPLVCSSSRCVALRP